jgi:hypothetical protein
MKGRLLAIIVALVGLIGSCALALSCFPRYLDEPPKEFYRFVQEVPTPAASEQLAEDLHALPAPKQVCTLFVYSRLYGTYKPYFEVLLAYRVALEATGRRYVERRAATGITVFVLGEHGLVGMNDTSVSDEVAVRQYGETVLRVGQASFPTLFIVDIEHSYGNCDPHPWWEP